MAKSNLHVTAPSLTEAVYLTVRQDLLSCVIPPGDKINTGEIARRLQANVGSVREALSRLTSEGLVTSQNRKGYSAAPVSVEDLKDLTEARIELENACLRDAIDVGGPGWERKIEETFESLIAQSEFETLDGKLVFNEDWASAHSEFHMALLAACESVWMLRLRSILYDQSERYRRLSIKLRLNELNSFEPGRSERDHRILKDAVLSRNVEAAETTMREHLRHTANLVRVFAEHDVPQRPVNGPSKQL